MSLNLGIQRTISLLMLLGILISATLVLIGGALYLQQYGYENLRVELLQTDIYQASVIEMLKEVFLSLSPLGIVELGLLSLVATQILRVGLLAIYYIYIKDYWFTLISTFILLMLIYSFLWRR